MAKTLYHGALRKLGAVKVTVKSDVLQSQFPGKPPYVVLNIGGEDFNYSTENDSCAAFFAGQNGRTFTIVAEGGGKGKSETATITYVGEAASEASAPLTPPKATQRSAPQPPARQTAPAGRTTPPPTQRPPAAKPGQHPQAGQRVGMAIKSACDYCMQEGIPWNPKEIMDRASDLLRISESLENGHLSPKYSERHPAPAE